MKKIRSIITILLVLFLGVSCSKLMGKIQLPNGENLTNVVVTDFSHENQKEIRKEILNIDNKKEMKTFMDMLKSAKKTKIKSEKGSLEYDKYYMIEFVHKIAPENPSLVYVYEKNDKYYLEQPFNGVYQITKEMYDKIGGK